MTGIAAIFSRNPVELDRIDRMIGPMEDRARDGIETWRNGPVAMAACLLHTTAESLEADQPHRSEDGRVAIVLDGYLSNYDELRRDLLDRGARLRNRSDVELVLRSYEQWGEGCIERLDGEFAFVIADLRRNRMFCARDLMGLRPLFYCRQRDSLLVASDIPAVIAALDRLPKPNMDFLAGVSTMHFFLRDGTAWEDVKAVKQSHALTFDGERILQRRFYELPVAVSIRYKSEDEYAEHYRHVLFDAVRRASRTHRPLAVANSGGLDSSALLGVADRLERSGDLLAPSIRAYTLDADPDSPAYEIPFALDVANHLDRPLIRVPLFKPEVEWFTRQARVDRDVPVPTNGAMTIDIERRVRDDGSRVYINGEGGDEWLRGNVQYYQEFVEERDWRGFSGALFADARSKGAAWAIRNAVRMGVWGILPADLRPRLRQYRARWLDSGEQRLFWLQDRWRERLRELEAIYEADLPVHQVQRDKRNVFSSAYGHFARYRMQRQRGLNGIEARHPMMSRQFIEFGSTTPHYSKMHSGQFKLTHRRAMRGILPPSVIERTSKAEFESDAIDLQFAAYLDEGGARLLTDLCAREGLDRLIGLGPGLHVDLDWSWAVWGNYAVAAFLDASTG